MLNKMLFLILLFTGVAFGQLTSQQASQVRGVNRLVNGDFESGIVGFTLSSVALTLTNSTSLARSGKKAMTLTGTAIRYASFTPIQVKTGDRVYGMCHFKLPAVNGGAFANLTGTAGALVDSKAFTYVASGSPTPTPTDKWFPLMVGPFIATSDGNVRLEAGFENGSSVTTYMDDCYMWTEDEFVFSENLLPWGNIEGGLNISNFTGYNDGSAIPVDCTGGTPSNSVVPFSTSLVVISGTQSMKMQATGSAQGTGYAHTIKIQPGFRGRTLSFNSDFKNNGTFVYGTSSGYSDITVWIYDVTNSKLVPMSNNKVFAINDVGAGTVSYGKINSTFQLDNNTEEVRLCLHNSNTAAFNVNMDNLEIKPLPDISSLTISQAVQVGTWTMNGAANCFFDQTSTSYASFSADSDCSDGVPTGAISNNTKKPSFIIGQQPAGKFKVSCEFMSQNQGGGDTVANYRFTDGTNNSNEKEIYQNTQNFVIPVKMSWDFVDEDGFNSKTIDIQSKAQTGSITIPNNAGKSIACSVERFPISDIAAQAVNPPGIGDVLIVGSSFSDTTISGTFDTVNAGWTIASSGLCTAPTTSGDLACKVPLLKAGQWDLMVTGFMRADYSASQTNCVYEIHDGTDQIAASLASVTDTGSDSIATIAGTKNYTSDQTNIEFKVRFKREVGGGTCGFYNDAASQRITFSLRPAKASEKSFLAGSVLSNSVSQQRLESTLITITAGVPSITRQSGTWLSSVTDNAVGDFTLNFVAGIFADTPVCTCTSRYDSTTGVICTASTGTSSNSAQRFEVFSDSGAGADAAGYNIMCMGTKP